MKAKFLLLPALGLFLTFTSCKKETTTTPTPTTTTDANESKNSQISSGSWTTTSWTDNGAEMMGSLLNSVIMTYKKEDKANGTVTFAIIDVTGSSQNISGKYEIRNKGTEIDIDGDILNLTINGSNLQLDGNFQGSAVVMKAKK